jgi:hypothetical protein
MNKIAFEIGVRDGMSMVAAMDKEAGPFMDRLKSGLKLVNKAIGEPVAVTQAAKAPGVRPIGRGAQNAVRMRNMRQAAA